MKIRADFVTNSSSSSFTVVSVNTCDGRSFPIDMGEMMWSDDSMCHFKDGKLMYTYWDINGDRKDRAIKTLQQLLAIIYFNYSDTTVPYEIINPVFGFLIGKSSPRKLLEALEDVDGFEELQDIDPDDFDDRTELRETVMETLVSCLEEAEIYVDIEDEQLLLAFKNVMHNISNLNDIANVTVHIKDSNWGECTNMYIEQLERYVNKGKHPFVPVPVDSPEYPEVVTRWTNVMDTEVLMGDTPQDGCDLVDCVRTALASGNVWDMMPNVIQSNQEIVYSISEE